MLIFVLQTAVPQYQTPQKQHVEHRPLLESYISAYAGSSTPFDSLHASKDACSFVGDEVGQQQQQ
jgi:hypothetical protein